MLNFTNIPRIWLADHIKGHLSVPNDSYGSFDLSGRKEKEDHASNEAVKLELPTLMVDGPKIVAVDKMYTAMKHCMMQFATTHKLLPQWSRACRPRNGLSPVTNNCSTRRTLHDFLNRTVEHAAPTFSERRPLLRTHTHPLDRWNQAKALLPRSTEQRWHRPDRHG